MSRQCLGLIFYATASLILLHLASNVSAAPSAQNPTPTDEPTKRPYVFPTPIFIPTFVSATDLPPRGVTRAPASPTMTAATQPSAASSVPAPSTPTRTQAAIAAIEVETPTAGTVSDTADLAQAAESALLAMGGVMFIGFVIVSGSAFLVYRRNQREEKIAAMKARLKSK